jgi:hypothetical protein
MLFDAVGSGITLSHWDLDRRSDETLVRILVGSDQPSIESEPTIQTLQLKGGPWKHLLQPGYI